MNDTITLLGQQVPVALLLVYFQNWAKKQSWFPWLTYESKRANHLAAIALSGLATIGISVSHTGGPVNGGTIILHMPPLAVLITSLYHWLQQYILTKTSYSVLQTQLNPITSQPPIPVVVVPGSKSIDVTNVTSSTTTVATH